MNTIPSQGSLNYWHVLLFFLLLLCLRLLGVFNVYFFEEDEVSIAAGVAALLRDNVGDLYRYSVQVGYYRLIEFCVHALGGAAELIPVVMKYMLALAGTLIPMLVIFLFRRQLTQSTRWLAAIVLFANPILWKSSQYGNTAIVATSVSLIAMCLLSNATQKKTIFLALMLYGASVMIRADMVLLAPLEVWLVNKLIQVVHLSAFGLIFLACYGVSLPFSK